MSVKMFGSGTDQNGGNTPKQRSAKKMHAITGQSNKERSLPRL